MEEFELDLELSIGGRYGESENSKTQIWKSTDENAAELQRRKEVQAERRQEARRKREEKIRKGRGRGRGVLAEERLFWEAQKLQARAMERESRERDCVSEERGGDELSLSLSTEKNRGRGLYPKVQQWWGRNVGDGNVSVDSEYSNGRKTASLEQCSSAVSDYQSMSHNRGGCSSDTGSHSSLQPPHPPATRNESDQPESHDSSSPADADQVPALPKRPPSTTNIPRSTPDSFPDTNNASSTSGNLSRETSSGAQTAAASIPRMPCVSTTGNGPNARTVMGFLYKYTKTEVSIVCVCHGRSFSPAAFVEHAGGVDVSQPLRHITIVPTVLR